MKAIIFDYGGTLDTNGVHWSEKFRDVYKQIGLEIPDKDFNLSYAYAVKEMDRFVDKTYSLFQTIHRQVHLQLSYLKENPSVHFISPEHCAKDAAQLCYNDVLKTTKKFKPLLQSLCSKYLLGLVSNYHGNLTVVCNELKLNDHFKVMIDSSVVNIWKPDPRIFEAAIKELNVSPAETYVVGDSYDRDIVPAKSLGCKTIWLKGRSWKEEKETSQADIVIGDLKELKDLLLSDMTLK